MKQIGFVMRSQDCDRPMGDLIEKLYRRTDLQLVVVALEGDTAALVPRQRDDSGYRIRAAARWLFFQLLARAEALLARCFVQDLRLALSSVPVEGVEARIQEQSGKGTSLRGLVDLECLEGFDLLVADRGIPTETIELFPPCADGVVRFPFGVRERQENRQAALAVLNRHPSTPYVIDIKATSNEAAVVCRSGLVATRLSMSRNRVDVAKILRCELEDVLVDYLETGAIERREGGLICRNGRTEFDNEDVPGIGTMLSYFGALVYRFIKSRLFTCSKAVPPEWHLGYVHGSEDVRDLWRSTFVTNPAGRYFADPFVVERDSRTVCFVEDFGYNQGRACISAIEISDDGGYELLGPVISEDFHMSFPFMFDFEESLYMIPETQAAGQVRLYVCESFPMEWRLVSTCLEGLSVVDPIVFEHAGRWWLFCGMPVIGGSARDVALHIFFGDSPLTTGWEPHRFNPVLVNNQSARNGGVLLNSDRLPIRVRQKQGFDQYGSGFSLAQILELSPTEFEESEIGSLVIDGVPGFHGAHHLDRATKVTIADFLMVPGTDVMSLRNQLEEATRRLPSLQGSMPT